MGIKSSAEARSLLGSLSRNRQWQLGVWLPWSTGTKSAPRKTEELLEGRASLQRKQLASSAGGYDLQAITPRKVAGQRDAFKTKKENRPLANSVIHLPYLQYHLNLCNIKAGIVSLVLELMSRGKHKTIIHRGTVKVN